MKSLMIDSSSLQIVNEVFENGTKAIELTQGYYTIIDESDFELVSRYSWRVLIQKRRNGSIKDLYARSRINGKIILMHRFILGLTDPKILVDHINHDGLNNCRENLRLCTSQQNCRNRQKQPGLSSKFKGVYWDRNRNKWRSSIRVDSKYINLGRFENELDAAITYNKKAVELFGEFAKLNNLEEIL